MGLKSLLRRLRRPCAGAALCLTLLTACGGAQGAQTRAVEISMRYSKFLPASLKVTVRTTVTFTLRNDDPIAHEFILGDEATQNRHESGKEETHDGQHGQASLKAGEVDTVVYTFDKPGTLIFGCHKPGHYAYGMRGLVNVEA